MKVTFWQLLGVLFIGLKLGGLIDWPWWWVSSPLIFLATCRLVYLCVKIWVEAMHEERMKNDPIYSMNYTAKGLGGKKVNR
jgi:hypothetical protein